MDRVTRARLVGGGAGVGALVLAALGQWGPAVGLLTASAGVLLLVTERDVPPRFVADGLQGSLAATAHLARALHLAGRGIVVPTPDGARLFVPARDDPRVDLPVLGQGLVLHRDGPGDLGVELPPPGAGLEAAWRDRHGLPQGRGAEEAADHLRRAFRDLGLGDGVVVAQAPGRLRIAYAPRLHAHACRESRGPLAPWHLQGGCPACSFAAILAAHALGAPVRLRDAGAEGERVALELEVGPWTPT